MCLIIFDWQPDEKRVLTLASNRDEFYARPSQDAHFWADHPHIFGGRDLKMNGTWLAVSNNLRLAAVTNYRSPDRTQYSRSRGEIPSQFLNSSLSALEYAKQLSEFSYAGYNALLYDGQQLIYCHNQASDENNNIQVLTAGHYGLSNHFLDTPWPKVQLTKLALGKTNALTEKEEISEVLLTALQNKTEFNDEELPDTGIGLELERLLSSPFIVSPSYGTRTSSVVMIEKETPKSASIYFLEKQHQNSTRHAKDTIQRIRGSR